MATGTIQQIGRKERKCWHLQTGNGPSEQAAVQTPREARAKPSQSVAAGGPYAGPGFKDFVAQHEAPNYQMKTLKNFMPSSWNGTGGGKWLIYECAP